MRTFLSSIFSSETVSFADHRGSHSLKAIALVVLLVGAGEGLARVALAPIGDYWAYWTPAAAAKFESYRGQVRRGVPPRVVVVGDSTGARDIDPRSIAEATGESAFNLAWPANFPLAFADCTLAVLENAAAPRLVVASFIPTGFLDSASARRFEAAILESPYCRRQRHERSATDVSYLARVRPALPFSRSWWTGSRLPQVTQLGFMPLAGVDDEPEVPTVMSGFQARRFGAIEALARAGRRFDFRVVTVIPPRREVTPDLVRAETEYLSRLQQCGLEYLDLRSPAFLAASDFHDRSHLNAHGAELYSRQLGAALAALPAPAANVRAAGCEAGA